MTMNVSYFAEADVEWDQGLSGIVITWRGKGWPVSRRAGSLQSTVTPSEEVRPMNAVSMWVLSFPVTAGG
jgi:hypothetical protein